MQLMFAPLTLAVIIASDTAPTASVLPSDLAKWVVTSPPDSLADSRRSGLNKRLWAATSDTDHDWLVFLHDGRPSARLVSPGGIASQPLPFTIAPGTSREGLAGKRLSVRVEDGWIVAFNAGEWGAGVWWFSPDGGRRYRIASDCWINGYVSTDAGLLALEGISHGNTRGRIIRLVKGVGGRWEAETFIPLGEEPYAAAKDRDGSLVVVTHDRLLRVKPGKRRVENLVAQGFWGGLYPQSLFVAGDKVYIGMRHGVARFDLAAKIPSVAWLLPIAGFDRVTSRRKGFQ
jgi:hypothetical protein